MPEIDVENQKDLPHPNPYFPPPPRPVRRLGCLGSLIAFAYAIGVWTLMAQLVEHVTFGVVFLLLLIGCGLAVFAILAANERLKAGPWTKGPIVPARVYVAPKGPPASLVWHVLGFIPIIGLLISAAAGWAAGPRNRVQLVYFKDGIATDAVFQADRSWKRYRDRLDIWICVNKKGEVVPLEHIAPRKFQDVEVPAEVSAWIDANLPPQYAEFVVRREQELLEPDARKAAKANTKAFKKAAVYEKRPD